MPFNHTYCTVYCIEERCTKPPPNTKWMFSQKLFFYHIISAAKWYSKCGIQVQYFPQTSATTFAFSSVFILINTALGWSVEFFWSDRTGQVTIGMIPKFWRTHAQPTCVKEFIFKKLQRAQILIFFGENWQGAFFYIKQQTQKYKYEIWLFKSIILDPKKSVFLVFEENPPKNFCLCVSALIRL